ncbi:MAG: HpcH/HpaI aldolase/citrate lyase family protein [Alphaproteobacteria bacterium]
MNVTSRLRRSALYVPGSNERALEKARAAPTDVLILDLEDAVAPDAKSRARDAVAATVRHLVQDSREIVVRVNALDTPWIARDLTVIAAAQPDAILVPKISRTEDIRRIRAALGAAGAPRNIRLWAMIETPAAVLHAAEIAAVAAMPAPAVTCFVLGSNDLAAELGARILPGREALVPHIAAVLVAARAYGLAVLDGTFNNIADEAGFRAECAQARNLGLDGKTLIHPVQVADANRLMAPSKEEIAWARRVVDAFAAPDNVSRDVISVGGHMVERLHERLARRVLEIAAAIEANGTAR